MNRKFIARQLILEAKRLLAAGKDDSDYVYDPDHKHKPKGGHWEKTEKGWTTKKHDVHKQDIDTEQVKKSISNIAGQSREHFNDWINESPLFDKITMGTKFELSDKEQVLYEAALDAIKDNNYLDEFGDNTDYVLMSAPLIKNPSESLKKKIDWAKNYV